MIHDIETEQYRNINQFQKQLLQLQNTFSLVYRNTQTVSFLFLLCLFILSPSQTVFLPTLFSILSFFRFHFLFHPFLFIHLSIFCATLSIPFFSFHFSSLFFFLPFFQLPSFPSAHLRNSIISRLYIPPINILECATNSNREGEPIIRNEGINQSPLEEVKSKKKKKKKYRNIDGSNVIITQSPRNSNARREIVSSHRDPTASTEDAAKHDRIGRPDKTSNLLSRPFLIGLLLLPTSSAGSTARIIYAKLM